MVKNQKSKNKKFQKSLLSHKQQMKNVLKQLSLMKKKHIIKNNTVSTIHELHEKKKKEKKLQNNNNNKFVLKQKIILDTIEQQNKITVPKVNIFAVDQYNEGIKEQNNIKKYEIQQIQDLGSKAKKMMQGGLNFEKFGDKPMKIIKKIDEINESQQDQQIMKKLNHLNLKIPQGNYKIIRKKKIQQFRKNLPIYMLEQQIIETINNNIVLLICGQTGSGKSTQLPQFLIEKNYHTLGCIAITQPRKLATITLAHRVAQQINSHVGKKVAYQVRHQRKESPESIIKFMTDGILLKQLNSDLLLLKYAVVIIDEAHERKINTDILIGLLSKVILIRYQMALQGKCEPLRLIIMSATMRVQDFQNSKLFNFTIPIIKVQSKMFPVTVFYEKETPSDYISKAISKCVKIHSNLPKGDVLVFLTGKQEINDMVLQLQQALETYDQNQSLSENQKKLQMQVEQQNEKLCTQFLIFKLYSSLSTKQQNSIFQKVNENTRKFIISTNIAETSLTIPNVRYVVDCGQQKHRYFKGVWKWHKGWGSKAMAQQRAGRAGRTTHGYCYRLYSNALYSNLMQNFSQPEIMIQPLNNVILQLKSLGISNIITFPFPTPPNKAQLVTTLQNLLKMGTIQGHCTPEHDDTTITQMGQILSLIPVQPNLGKMLLIGRKFQVELWVLYMVVLLTVEEIWTINPKQALLNQKNNYISRFKPYQCSKQYGDIFLAINLLGQFFIRITTKYKLKKNISQIIIQTSEQLFLNSNIMYQVYYNTDQISEIYNTLTQKKININQYIQPNSNQLQIILDILLHTYVQNVCRFKENKKYQNKNGQQVLVQYLSTLNHNKNMFLGCTGFQQTNQGYIYMKYPFLIHNYELLVTYGSTNPILKYTWTRDKVYGLTTGQINGWQIPNILVQAPTTHAKYIFIAKKFLSGEIFPSFKVLNKYLNDSISHIKSDSIDEKVCRLIQPLKIYQIGSKQNFITRFKFDKTFWKQQLKLWYNINNFNSFYDKIIINIINDNL